MSDFLKPSTERHTISRRGFAIGLGINLGLIAASHVDIGAVLAQCVGPNVPCPTPDGIARHSFAEVFRQVRNGGKDYAISDAAVRVYVLKPIGTSDYPELDRQNPKLDSDGLPAAFRDTKYDLWRDVEKRVVFKAAEPGDPRFNGKLIDTETGLDYIEIARRGDELKDRAIGRLRGAIACAPAAANCVLNCAEIVVFERQKGGTRLEPFVNSKGQIERFQAALWSWPYSEPKPSKHSLVSYTDVSDEELRKLLANGEAATGLTPQFTDLHQQLELVK